MNKKFRLGVFKFSCCAGCQFQIIYFQRHILEFFRDMEVVYFKMAQSGGIEEGPFDLVLIEGAITEAEQAHLVKRVRKSSRWLIPIGSCAVNGGIPAIKNRTPELEVEQRVYGDLDPVRSMMAEPIDAFVPVDGYIKGCPVGEPELVETVISLLMGKKPGHFDYPVCVECKLRQNLCVLVAFNKPCMGPVTSAGCGALCPSHGRACFACWGPVKEANGPALARQFERMGFGPEDIYCRFTQYGSTKAEFRRGAELYDETR
jgi:coenzyme F420-reducing hydrogenase gamma subunit